MTLKLVQLQREAVLMGLVRNLQEENARLNQPSSSTGSNTSSSSSSNMLPVPAG